MCFRIADNDPCAAAADLLSPRGLMMRSSLVAFARRLEEEARREFARQTTLRAVLYGEGAAVFRMRRYHLDGEALAQAEVATDCAVRLGRVGARRGGLLAPTASGELCLVFADDARAEALLAPVVGDELGPFGAPAPAEGLFADALAAGVSRRPCPDCGALPGALHGSGCDVARCANCRQQSLACGCEDIAEPWAGEWPGVYECRALDFFARRTAEGWEPCSADSAGARPDLNRLSEYWGQLLG